MNPPPQTPETVEELSSPHRRSSLNSTFLEFSTSIPKRDLSAMSAAEEKQKKNVPFIPLEEIRSGDALGQLSYAPATQTTVVTTTTTTTTKFPPLMVKAPRHLHDLDPKQYPLASTPTPHSIKKLCFDVEGRPTMFQEADDTLETLEKVRYVALVDKTRYWD
jgi:hypothetical protein